MIQAETIAHFYFDLESLADYETIIRRYLEKLSGPINTIEVISIDKPFKSRTGFSSRVAARMHVLMDERQSCRHLDDYYSFVFSTVKKNIAGDLISTQNLHLEYVRGPFIANQKKKTNWEELITHWNR
ncbi:hypothetical protein [Evansella tamaricis]|uniref:Uncharacterized protein n=1 Tax=Evansella tamaricis TaxID=2069301 RepID=A0ABS6JI33_9BACI|nr:hypothetical protein [Evansella tamaricis]MBU9711998.1 hypothetical protein [Evansella tamaricis]